MIDKQMIYNYEIIATIIAIFSFVLLWFIIKNLVSRITKKSGFSISRYVLVMKYIRYMLILLIIVVLISIWGVKGDQIFLFISSILTIVGVALFAQWSVLSNVTAGIIVFFSYPFKIGDRIKIMDKDFPLEAEIKDILSFYTLLETSDGEEISYPNNLFLQKAIVLLPKEK